MKSKKYLQKLNSLVEKQLSDFANKPILFNSCMSFDRKDRKRVGRGPGNKGRSAGRGKGGQHTRVGSIRTEGGQFPTYLKFKKIGFYSKRKQKIKEVSLVTLSMIAIKNPEKNIFSVSEIKTLLKIKSHLKLKAIGSNMISKSSNKVFSQESEYVFWVDYASKSLWKSKFLKINA